MNRFKIYSKALLLLLVSLLTFAATSCSDDETGGWDGTYGYVQFKLSKKVSSRATRAAALDKLEKLDDAKKIKVVMEHNGTTVSQTLVLNSYNSENAEYGLRSEKLQLASGTYTVIGFYLYDAVDEELLASSAGETFTVVGGGLEVQNLMVETVERGKVKFNLVKEWEKTRAGGTEYLFSNIRLVDVSVTNLFTRETYTFPELKVKYKESSVEHQNPDNENDKYMDTGTAYCDSTVWLPAGTYQVTSYTTYGKTGAVKTKYETQPVKGEAFIVEDNQLNDTAQVPILLSKTKEYIKDYEALKAIWESLHGKEWSFYGDATFKGANWNFNKELDMWGEQPGVTLNSNGRVIGLVIAGFGAKGIVPDAIGQLTELQVLNLGSHDEKIGANIFNNYDANSISILEGLEAVRKRPGMYIGSVSTKGLNHLIYEIVDNSVDEHLAGYCSKIYVTLEKDGTAVITDNGRGIPVGINAKTGLPAVEVVFTMLHAGGKFGDGGYKISGGLHGVGASVVNALSEWLEVTIKKDGVVYRQRYERGKVMYPLEQIGTCRKNDTGTSVRFLPDGDIFDKTYFKAEAIKGRLHETAYLNPDLTIIFENKRFSEEEKIEYHEEEGICAYVKDMNQGKEVMM